MDFMLLNKSDQAIVDFDVRSEIVSKDKFLTVQRNISVPIKKHCSTDNHYFLIY